jgi:hypothetical protein
LFIIALRETAVQSATAAAPGRGSSEVHAEAVASTTAATSAAKDLPPFTPAVSPLPGPGAQGQWDLRCVSVGPLRRADVRAGGPMCAPAGRRACLLYVPVFTKASPVPILKSTMILLARATLAS